MARVVNMYPQAPFSFVIKTLKILARVKNEEVGNIYRDLISRRRWTTIPAVWQALWTWRRMPAPLQAKMLCLLLVRHPRLLSCFRSAAQTAVANVEDNQERLRLLVDLARSSGGRHRAGLIEKAIDLFRVMLGRQESNVSDRFLVTTPYHPLRLLYEIGSASNRERILHTISDCKDKVDQERLLHYEICLFPALSKEDREKRGIALLGQIKGIATHSATGSFAEQQFRQMLVIFLYWVGPGRIWPLQSLFRLGAQVTRRSWFYTAREFLAGFRPDQRSTIAAAGVQSVKNAIRLWP